MILNTPVSQDHHAPKASSSDGLPGIPNVVTVPNRNYGGSYVHVFNPSLVLQVEFGRTTVGDNAVAEFTKSTQSLISQIGFSPTFVGNFAAAPGSFPRAYAVASNAISMSLENAEGL